MSDPDVVMATPSRKRRGGPLTKTPQYLQNNLRDEVLEFPKGYTSMDVGELKRIILSWIPQMTIRAGEPLDGKLIARYDTALFKMSHLVDLNVVEVKKFTEKIKKLLRAHGRSHLLTAGEARSTTALMNSYRTAMETLCDELKHQQEKMRDQNQAKILALQQKDLEIAQIREASIRQRRDEMYDLRGTMAVSMRNTVEAANSYVQEADDKVRVFEAKLQQVEASAAKLSESQYRIILAIIKRTFNVDVREGSVRAARRGDYIQKELAKVAAELKELRSKDVDGRESLKLHQGALRDILTVLKSNGVLSEEAAAEISLGNTQALTSSITSKLTDLAGSREEAKKGLEEARRVNSGQVSLMNSTIAVLEGGASALVTPQLHPLLAAASNQMRYAATLAQTIGERNASIAAKDLQREQLEQQIANGVKEHDEDVTDMTNEIVQLKESKQLVESQQKRLDNKLKLLGQCLQSVTSTWKEYEFNADTVNGNKFDLAVFNFRQITDECVDEGDTFTLELQDMVSRMINFKAVKEANINLSKQSDGLFGKIKQLQTDVDTMRDERDAAQKDVEALKHYAANMKLTAEQMVLWTQGRYLEVFQAMEQKLVDTKQLVDNLTDDAEAMDVADTGLADYAKSLDAAFKHLEGALGEDLMRDARAKVPDRIDVGEGAKQVETLTQAIQSLKSKLSTQTTRALAAKQRLDRVRSQYQAATKAQKDKMKSLKEDLKYDRIAYEHLQVEAERTYILLEAAEDNQLSLRARIDELETLLTKAHEKQLVEIPNTSANNAFRSGLIKTISSLSEEKGIAEKAMDALKDETHRLRRKVLEFGDLEGKLDRANASTEDLKGQLKFAVDYHSKYKKASKQLQDTLRTDVTHAETRLEAAHEEKAKFEAEAKALRASLAEREADARGYAEDLIAKTAEVDELKAKNDALEKRYDEANAKLVEAERVRLESEASGEGATDALTAQVAQLTGSLKTAGDLLHAEQAALRSKRGELRKMREDRDAATETIARLNEQVDRIVKDREPTQMETSLLSKEVERLTEELNRTFDDQAKHMAKERQAIDDLRREASEARAARKDLGIQLDLQKYETTLQATAACQLQHELAGMLNKYQETKQQVRNLTAERTASAASKATSNKAHAEAMATLTEEIRALGEQKATVDKELEGQKQATTDAEEKLEVASGKLDQIRTELASSSKDELEKLKRDLTAEHKQKVESLTRKQTGLKSDLDKQKAATKQAWKELKDEQRRAQIGLEHTVVLRVGNNKLTKELAEATAEKSKLQERLTDTQVELDKERQKTTEAQERADQVEGERQKQESKSTQLEASISTLTKQFEGLSTEKDALLKNIKDLKAMLAVEENQKTAVTAQNTIRNESTGLLRNDRFRSTPSFITRITINSNAILSVAGL